MITYIIIAISVIFVLLLCFALAIASFSSENYLENFKELNSINFYEITTRKYVESINEKYFYNRIKIEHCERYKDHYSRGKISLSDETLDSNSLASLAVVSHELGHAKQDFEGKKLENHWRLRRTGRICGYFFSPTLILGIVLCLLSIFNILTSPILLYLGFTLIGFSFLIFIFAIILKYKEIQIEKEASENALLFLNEILNPDDVLKCKKFLYSARLTYWAALFKTMFGWTRLTSKNKMFK